MANLVHAICEMCWDIHYGGEADGTYQQPVRQTGTLEWCCWCGDETDSGILVKADPADMHCDYLHDGGFKHG